MNAKQFAAWRIRNRYSKAGAGRDLNRSRMCIWMYETGRLEIPVEISLACDELERQRADRIRKRPNARIIPSQSAGI